MNQLPRREFLKSIPLAASALQGASAAQITASRRRPNFLVIVTDDQGIGDVGCYGHPEVRTPNLDRLAASGVRFKQWYSNAPICSASRAAIMTGKYPDRAGVKGALPSNPEWNVPGLKPGENTLPRLLKQRGYRTAAFGKWHLGSAPQSRPMAQGFDSFFGWYSGWLDAYSHRYYQLGSPPGKIFHDLWRNEAEVFEEPAYIVPVLQGKKQTHEYMFWSFNKQRAVRFGDWKLILNPPSYPGDELTDKVWLSNLEADPGEKKNLAGQQPDRVRQLTERIRAWERDVQLAPE